MMPGFPVGLPTKILNNGPVPMNSDATDILHECETEPCRGRIIALLLEVGRLLSEKNDIVAALDCLLDYMRREMGMARYGVEGLMANAAMLA